MALGFVLWLLIILKARLNCDWTQSFQAVLPLGMWTLLSKSGNYVAESFLNPQWSVKIETTELCDMVLASTMSLTFSFWFVNILFWIVFIFQVIVSSVGRRESWGSLAVIRRHTEHMWTVAIRTFYSIFLYLLPYKVIGAWWNKWLLTGSETSVCRMEKSETDVEKRDITPLKLWYEGFVYSNWSVRSTGLIEWL